MRLAMATCVLRIAAVTAALQGTAHANEILGVPRIVDGDTVQIGATKIRLERIVRQSAPAPRR
jgi:hypothetical protein